MTARLLLSFAPPAVALHLFGDFDLAERASLRMRVTDLLALDGDEVEIDASKVTYVDSGCLEELESAAREIGATGRSVRIRAASQPFRDAAVLAGFDALLPEPAGVDGRRPMSVRSSTPRSAHR